MTNANCHEISSGTESISVFDLIKYLYEVHILRIREPKDPNTATAITNAASIEELTKLLHIASAKIGPDANAKSAISGIQQAIVNKEQERRSKKPRPDPLTEEIKTYISSHPRATQRDVRHHIESIAIPGEIIDQTDEKCIWYLNNGSLVPAPWSSLKDRIYHIRQSF